MNLQVYNMNVAIAVGACGLFDDFLQRYITFAVNRLLGRKRLPNCRSACQQLPILGALSEQSFDLFFLGMCNDLQVMLAAGFDFVGEVIEGEPGSGGNNEY